MTTRRSEASLFQRAFDVVADASVVLSYTAIGYNVRRRHFQTLHQDMRTKHVVITGANSGIGRAAAESLARLGATMTLVCRNPARGERARDEIIAAAGHTNVTLRICDMSVIADVHRLCDDLLSDGRPIDRLVLNAGMLPDSQRITDEGLDETFATNLLSGFVMTKRLVPLLAKADGARVVNVTSGGMYTQRLDLTLVQGETDKFDGTIAYAQTKRAQVILTELWSVRLAEAGIQCHAMHPGWADTAGVKTSLPTFHRMLGPVLRDANAGADTMVWLCTTDADIESGRLWLDRKKRKTHIMKRTRSHAGDRDALFELCTDLSNRLALHAR